MKPSSGCPGKRHPLERVAVQPLGGMGVPPMLDLSPTTCPFYLSWRSLEAGLSFVAVVVLALPVVASQPERDSVAWRCRIKARRTLRAMKNRVLFPCVSTL